MSSSTRASRRTRAWISIAVLMALVIPLSGSAFADVVGITITPTADSAPNGTCNAFTVTLVGDAQTADVSGQTVDVAVQDTDTDDQATFGDESQSPVRFCTPTTADGPNPQFTHTERPTVKDTNSDLNTDNSNTTGTDEFGDDPPGDDGSIQGETCCTDVNGQITFGIVSNVAGHYSVTAFYDTNDSEEVNGQEFSATASKTFTGGNTTNQCQDGQDNDGDGFTDFPNDPQCESSTDNDESSAGGVPPSQCQDGVDNDGDGKIDFGSDGGCTSATDNDETGTGDKSTPTAVTIRYNQTVHRFKGTVAAKYRKCRVNRKIVLKKKRPGADKVVKSTRTNDKGNYAIKKRHVGGKTWYTVAKKKTFINSLGGTTTCFKGRSVYLSLSK